MLNDQSDDCSELNMLGIFIKSYRQPDQQRRSSVHGASALLNVEAADPGDDLADRGLHEHDGGKPAEGRHPLHNPLEISVAHEAAGDYDGNYAGH